LLLLSAPNPLRWASARLKDEKRRKTKTIKRLAKNKGLALTQNETL
jgi:hypothetical protein